MNFTNEKIADKVYLLRGYKQESDDKYIMVMNLIGNDQDKYDIKGFLSKNCLTLGDLKSLYKYLKSLGLDLYATVLKTDFKRFYTKRDFKEVIITKKA